MRTELEQQLDSDMLGFWNKLNSQPKKEPVERVPPTVESDVVELKGEDAQRFLSDPQYRELRLTSSNSNGQGV